MNTRLRIARGTDTAINSDSTISTNGHPIYNTNKKYLYVGDGNTAINANEPITTNRLVGWTSSTNISNPDYKIYGNTSNMFINSTKPIQTNIGGTTIFTVNSNGLTLGTNKTITATTFKGALDGNASTATTATNVAITATDTTNSTVVGFKIGTGTYTKTIDNVANATNVTTNINGKAITSIFDFSNNTVTAKKSIDARTASYYYTISKTLTADTRTLDSFTYNKATSALTSVNITTLNSSGISNVIDEYVLDFTAGSTISVNLPVTYANGWDYTADFEPGVHYLIYIINGIAYVSFIE